MTFFFINIRSRDNMYVKYINKCINKILFVLLLSVLTHTELEVGSLGQQRKLIYSTACIFDQGVFCVRFCTQKAIVVQHLSRQSRPVTSQIKHFLTNDLHFYNAFFCHLDQSKHYCQLPIRSDNLTQLHTVMHREQFGVQQCQGPFDMQTVGIGDQSIDPLPKCFVVFKLHCSCCRLMWFTRCIGITFKCQKMLIQRSGSKRPKY